VLPNHENTRVAQAARSIAAGLENLGYSLKKFEEE
jgi:hypothetical protein